MKVLQWLRELQFYLSTSKLDFFSDKTNCLGHVIDNNGIHTELDKMWWIREQRIPWNYNEVQRFLGLVQYLALYMPDIMAYTTLLSGLAQNNWTFQWTPQLDKCFQGIKAIATWSPILKPVDFKKNEPVWSLLKVFLPKACVCERQQIPTITCCSNWAKRPLFQVIWHSLWALYKQQLVIYIHQPLQWYMTVCNGPCADGL